MNNYPPAEIKHLISESLREKQNSYMIQELFQLFQTTTELLEANEELTMVKGIGIGKARQITALLQLARSLASPRMTKLQFNVPKMYTICSLPT